MEVAIYNDFERRKKGKRSKGLGPADRVVESGEKPEAAGRRVESEEKLASAQEGCAEPEEVLVSVLRVCANPRIVLCEYSDSGLDRRILVRVGRNVNFVTGMKLKAKRPSEDSEPWGYTGALPRFKGRW
jgi:hypothetical protein